jgi:hypothetical protein
MLAKVERSPDPDGNQINGRLRVTPNRRIAATL